MSIGALGAGTWGFGLNYLSGTSVNGVLGKYFNFTQNTHLVIYDDGDVDLISAENTLERFRYDAVTGKYSSEHNNTRSQLTRRNSGTPDDEFVLVSASGNTSVYFGVGATIKTPGRIKSLTDRYGNQQTFTWFATPTQVLLTSVTDSFGRTVVYRYYGSELFFRLREVEDFTGRKINFQYDTFGRLVAVITPSVLRAAAGNTFEGGTAYVFQYDINNRRPERRDDLVRIWYPNQATRFIDPATRTINVQEVYDAGEAAPPRYTIVYGQDPTDADQYGRVIAQTVGDTNGTVGGTYLLQYSSQWEDINIVNPFTDPVNQIVSRTVVTDRNGNQTEYHFNGSGMPIRKRVIATRNKNSLQGPDYITWTKFSARNQVLVAIFPEGNSVTNDYDDGQVTGIGFFAPRMGQLKSSTRKLGNDYGIPVSTQRSQPSNGQTQLTKRMFFEPIFTGVCATIEERGNPVTAAGAYFTPQNGGTPPSNADRSRYATLTYRDYQKNTDAIITNDAVLQALLGLNATQIQALLTHVDNQMKATDGTGGIPAGFERNLGDINGDGTGNGAASGLPAARQHGDMVRIKHPSVRLIGSAAITTQDRIEIFTTNNRGQNTTHTDPEGNVTAYVRYPLADPDGEGVFRSAITTDPEFETNQFKQYGRVKEIHVDIDPNDVMSLIGERGDLVDFIHKVSRTNTPGVYQKLVTRYEGTSLRGGCTSCAYDPLGNPLAITSPRGFTTHFERNELGEAFRVTSPEPYNYRTETYFDANRNAVRVDVEDKVVQYDSDDPSAAGYAHFTPTGGGSTAHVPTKPGPGGLVRPGWFTNLYTFDLLDNLVEEDIDATGANPTSLNTRYEYDANENRTKVIKPEGNTVEYDYDERDLLIATRDGYDPDAATDESATTVNVYDKNGNLLDVIGPAQRGGSGTSLSVIIEDAFGSGQPLVHTGDWLVENVYDGFDRVIKSIEAVGNVANNAFDPGGRVVRADRYGPVGGATPTNRSGTGNQKLAESEMRFDEAGRQYESQQNVFLATGTTILSNRPITHTGGGLAANSVANDHTTTVTLTTGSSSYVLTRTVFDRSSRAAEILGDLVQGASLSKTTLEYDGADRRIGSQDALGNRVDFAYDANSNLIRIVRTDVCTISQTPAIDPEVFESAMRYDSLDRLVIQADQGPDGVLNEDLSAAGNQTLFTRFGFDSRGNQTLLVDPKGNSSITIYDGASRSYQTVQHLRDKGQGQNSPIANQTLLPGSGATIVTTSVYDGNSRVTQLIDDRGNVTAFEYDALDRQTVMTFQDGSTRTSVYDQASDVVQYTDENGSVFTNTFDPVGRRTACAIASGSGVIGTTAQGFQFDGLSRLTLASDTVSGSSVSVDLRYDSLGRVLEDSQTVAGNRRDVTNSAFTSYPVTQFTFPQSRQLTNAYDLLYRRTSVSETTGGANIAAWQFFGPARVAEVKLGPNATSNLYCTFMNNARTHSAVQQGVSNPAWGAAGSDRLGYDGAGRMIAKRFLFTQLSGGAYQTTTPVVGFTTAFDAASNKLFERELHAESRSHLYQPFTAPSVVGDGGYDSLDRLRKYQRGTLSDGSGGSNPAPAGGSIVAGQVIALPNTNTQQSYDLDGLGNWKKTAFTPVGGALTTQNRRHNGLNQITRTEISGGATDNLAYDKSGNLTNDGTRLYKWDALNRLKEVYRTPASPVKIADYLYDALGRRVRKVVTNGGLNNNVPNDQLDYIYSGWRCVEERDLTVGPNAPFRQYVWGIYLDELVQLRVLASGGLNGFSTGDDLFPLQDLLYRTTALADSSGAIREAYDTDAYGSTLIFRNAGSPPNAIGFTNGDTQVPYPTCEFIFTGQRWDAESGCYFYKLRYYSPGLGRFVSKDPLGYGSGSWNWYSYVSSRATSWLDMLGLRDCYCCPNDCKDLPDFRKTLNAGIQSDINSLWQQAKNNNKNPKDLKKEFRLLMWDANAKDDPTTGPATLTNVESWIRKQGMHTPGKYLGRTGIWPFGHAIYSADCIKIVCGKETYCIGSDKIGHFFQQGHMLHEIATSPGLGRERAEAFARATEGLFPMQTTLQQGIKGWLINDKFKFHGFDETRLFHYVQKWGGLVNAPVPGYWAQTSWPDVFADVGGMNFWKDLMDAKDPSKFTFDICKYINRNWEECPPAGEKNVKGPHGRTGAGPSIIK